MFTIKFLIFRLPLHMPEIPSLVVIFIFFVSFACP